jgi:tRNA(Ile)-lysidine synthase
LPDLWPQVNFDHRPVSVPEARIVLPGGWVFTLGEAEPALEVVKPDPWTARLDAEALIEPLSIGTRRSGEVFEPFGMGRKKMKLGDFFTNVHLPTRAREHWPLVRSGDDVIWVPGFRIAEFCKVTAKTKRVVELELKKEKAGDVAG